MEFEFIYEPVPLIIIRNIFSSKENEEILSEAINNKKEFKPATTYDGNTKNFRNNVSSYYDTVYSGNRSSSKLLTRLEELFTDQKFINILNSSTYPINLFSDSNYHESQVSRYGDES